MYLFVVFLLFLSKDIRTFTISKAEKKLLFLTNKIL
jgi:hypothetical protein